MEGGDTFAFDKQTRLHPFFKIKPQGDICLYGVTGPLNGDHVYKNINTTPVKRLKFEYDQGFAANNVNDQILGNSLVKCTRNILANDGQLEKFKVLAGRIQALTKGFTSSLSTWSIFVSQKLTSSSRKGRASLSTASRMSLRH